MSGNAGEQEVLTVLHRYIEGYINADEAVLRDVFAHDAILNGHFDERLVEGTPERFIQRVLSEPPLSSLGLELRYEIDLVSVTGNAASAAVREFDFGGVNFTDYMHLLKRDGAWRIISKTFSTF